MLNSTLALACFEGDLEARTTIESILSRVKIVDLTDDEARAIARILAKRDG